MKTNLSLGFIGGGTNSTIGKMHYLASKLDSKWKLVSGFFSRNKKINIKSGISYNVNRSRVYHSLQSFIKYEKKDLDAVFALLGQLNEFDPNVIFLQAYTVDALSGVYLDQQDDWKAASLLRPILEKAWSQYAPKQTYDAYINLAIAAFNLNNFCVSYHSFDRAVKAGSKLKIKNNKLIEYRDMVKEKL